MAQKKGHFTCPYTVTLPQATLEEILLEKFSGEWTSRTLAAARRLQRQPRQLRVPRNLMNTLWSLIGGWKELAVKFYYATNYRYFPHRKMSYHGLGQYKGSDKNAPWRQNARVFSIGDLDFCFVKTNLGREGFLRWNGWVVGYIDHDKWTDSMKAIEANQNLAHKMTDAEADEWGFLRAGEEVPSS